MWALRVVIIYPGRDQIAGVGEVAKRGLVKPGLFTEVGP